MELDAFLEKFDDLFVHSRLSAKLDVLDRVFEDKIRVGLDIGMHTVKVVQIRDGAQGPELMTWGIRQIPSTGESREAVIAQIIRDLWQEKKIRTRRVRAVISAPGIYLRHITIPVVPDEDLIKAVKWQAEKFVPFSIDNAIVDFQVLKSRMKEGERQREIVIVAAEAETVGKYISMIRDARLIPTILDLTPFAAGRALVRNYSFESDELVPLVDIGHHTTSIVVVKNEDLQMIRRIEFGGRVFVESVAKDLGVPPAKAEDMMKNVSLENVTEEKSGDLKISMALESFMSELVGQLNRSLAYCEQEFSQEKIRRLFLCGGGARISGIERFLSRELGLETSVADPLTNMTVSPACPDADGFRAALSQLMPAAGEVL